MNEITILEKLASAARGEEVPEVDVSRKVLAALSEPEEDLNRPLAWIAGLSFAAAVPAVLFAFFVLDVRTDPLEELLSTFGGMML